MPALFAGCEVSNPAYDPDSPATGEVELPDANDYDPIVVVVMKLDSSVTSQTDTSSIVTIADALIISSLPFASTLRDDFADGVPSPRWTTEINGPCTIVEQNSQVRFNNAGSAASHCAYRSKGFYDLRGSFVQQRVPNITNYYPAVRAFLRVENKLGQSAQIGFVGTDNMFFEATGLASLFHPYGHQQDLWWRLGESNGNLYWETSPDAASWTRKRLAASTLDVSEVQIVSGEETTGKMPASVSIGYDTLGSP
jgi:hypothetical protein